ncbi:hypothetical protein [Streptomyces cinereospinus]|uniref:Uncharacterized protein n=1 Tax=Streptomyces cinereospinus TaxID=285561 RepID=A0ABV5NAM1_9ACTN
MKAPRARRLFAVTAIGVLMAGGAAIGTAGTASAAAPAGVPSNDDWWDRDHRDRYGHFFDPYGHYYNTFDRFGGTVVIVVR